MIFFSDMYNLLYYKMYGNQEKVVDISTVNNVFLYNGWREYLTIKEEFLSDINNIIYNYQINYKISPSHSQSNLQLESQNLDNLNSKSDGIEDNSNDFYYMCNCNEILRKQLQNSLSKLVKHHDKEWINNLSIMITHEISYLLNRVKQLRREIDLDIYDDIENQNSKNESLNNKLVSLSKLLYNSIYDILFNNELIKKYNSENSFFCNYCGEENGLIINNMCYDCYLYINVSNNIDNV